MTDSFIHLGEKLLNVLNRGIFSFEGFPCVALDKYQSKQSFFFVFCFFLKHIMIQEF